MECRITCPHFYYAESGHCPLLFLLLMDWMIKNKNNAVRDTLVNISETCSLTVTDNIMRITMIPNMEAAAARNDFFIMWVLLFSAFCVFVLSEIRIAN